MPPGVDIPVKDLDDATMIKIMANENMEEWRIGPKIIDETVRVAKKFLEDHPEEQAKVAPTGGTGKPLGVSVISRFLGWNETRVRYALERIRLIDEGVVDKEALMDEKYEP